MGVLPLDDLSLLTAVAHRLEGPLDRTEAVDAVLLALERERTLARTCLFLLDRGAGQLVLDRAPSIPMGRRRNARYDAGEGVVGSVALRGESRAVLRMSDTPEFQDRLGLRREV